MIIFSAIVAGIITFLINIKKKTIVLDAKYEQHKYGYEFENSTIRFMGYSNKKYHIRDLIKFAMAIGMDAPLRIRVVNMRDEEIRKRYERGE